MRIDVPEFVTPAIPRHLDDCMESDVTHTAENTLTNKLRIADFRQLNVAHGIQGWTINNKGNEITVDLWDLLAASRYNDYTMVLHGPQEMGKSPLALAICCFMARSLGRSYFLKTSTIDGLKECKHLMNEGVPILIDEWKPRAPVGTRATHFDVDEVKRICGIADALNLNARNRDIVTYQQQPRVVTSNALSAHEWCQFLPDGVKQMTPTERLEACSADSMAVFKRCMFFLVDQPIFDPENREQHSASCSIEQSKIMSSLLGERPPKRVRTSIAEVEPATNTNSSSSSSSAGLFRGA